MKNELEQALTEASYITKQKVTDLLEAFSSKKEFPAKERLQEAISYACCHNTQRFRAFLSLEASSLFKLSSDQALKLSSIVELVQSFHNIYDDLPAFDNSEVRRGKPTCHIVFDDPTTILAGVSLLSIVTDLLSQPDLHQDPQIRCELIRRFSNCIGMEGLSSGQLMDITTEHTPLTQEAIVDLYRLKKGSLMAFCVILSAIVAQAPEQERIALENYAKDLGVLYQLTDDILDMDTSIEDPSQHVREDVFLGKATLVNLLGLSATRAYAQELSERIIDHLKGFGPEADRLREIVKYVLNRRL